MKEASDFARLVQSRQVRARAIATAGSVNAALDSGSLPACQDLSLSETLVLGLLRQEVRTYLCVFGHGSTDLGEVLRVYADAGLVRVANVRSEIEASHAAAALRWQFGETAAVVTSIGPGALQALAASLTPALNSLGIYYLFGDETTHDEGYNMQQLPLAAQSSFLKLASAMGSAYSLHTGEAASACLKRAAATVFSSIRQQPFYLFLPMNVQPKVMPGYNIKELPTRPCFPRVAPADSASYAEAVRLLTRASRVVVKVGNGARGVRFDCLEEFLRRTDAAYVHGPSAVGLLPGEHPRNMTVGGSKGSISGNAAMAAADLVVTIGARAVCQWDSSGTAWKNAKAFISINTSLEDAAHYNHTLPLVGDASCILEQLVDALRTANVDKGALPTPWLDECATLRAQWDAHIASRLSVETLYDEKFGRAVLTQPVAIATAIAFAKKVGAVKYFDAGDVQANGFQLTEDGRVGMTLTDTGASYMGFASSGILACALTKQSAYPMAFTGDGSFMMNPQILIDAVQYHLHGMIVIFDNRKMAAISSLQRAQYGEVFATDDGVEVDYVAMASAVKGVHAVFGGYDRQSLESALEEAYAQPGLSVVHVHVYSGDDERGGLGAFGDWNVGNWCETVQRERHKLGL